MSEWLSADHLGEFVGKLIEIRFNIDDELREFGVVKEVCRSRNVYRLECRNNNWNITAVERFRVIPLPPEPAEPERDVWEEAASDAYDRVDDNWSKEDFIEFFRKHFVPLQQENDRLRNGLDAAGEMIKRLNKEQLACQEENERLRILSAAQDGEIDAWKQVDNDRLNMIGDMHDTIEQRDHELSELQKRLKELERRPVPKKPRKDNDMQKEIMDASELVARISVHRISCEKCGGLYGHPVVYCEELDRLRGTLPEQPNEAKAEPEKRRIGGGMFDAVHQTVAERDSEIASLQAIIGERNLRLNEAVDACRVRDREIERLKAVVSERDKRIGELTRSAVLSFNPANASAGLPHAEAIPGKWRCPKCCKSFNPPGDCPVCDPLPEQSVADPQDLSSDIVSGICCASCEIRFTEAHGHPVYCKTCQFELPSHRRELPVATHPEVDAEPPKPASVQPASVPVPRAFECRWKRGSRRIDGIEVGGWFSPLRESGVAVKPFWICKDDFEANHTDIKFLDPPQQGEVFRVRKHGSKLIRWATRKEDGNYEVTGASSYFVPGDFDECFERIDGEGSGGGVI